MKRSPSHLIGASFALAAFSVAVLSGLVAENSATDVLMKALLSMVLCFVCGYLIGLVCEYILNEHIRRRKADIARQSETSTELPLQQEALGQ